MVVEKTIETYILLRYFYTGDKMSKNGINDNNKTNTNTNTTTITII